MELSPIDPGEISRLNGLSYNELHSRLKLFLLDLLEHDFERLCALMYRHDVSETHFNEALHRKTDEERADEIATLVIEREKQKMATRAAYAKNKQQRTEKE
ncbi:MAG: hypothetical protein PHG67_05100 [Bacteroidales bacterium]|jgi:hypothetical protein|nr:hypothetical protein [Bacteroidales bacterium]HOI32101.1 hypothetical protein [Bacteroidales bacterium]